MSSSYLFHSYLHVVISFVSIIFFTAARDSATIAPLHLFFLSVNEYFLVPTVVKLYKRDSSHGSNRVTAISLLFTIFMANKHNRFRNC